MNASLALISNRFRAQRGVLAGALIIIALLAFEIFNYSTTDFALTDLLGDLNFSGMRWAMILAIAFCGIDLAGVARLFTPQQNADEPTEVWYLFGAWMLAAAMNAMLTWWGVSIAIINQSSLASPVVDKATLLKVVPIFVALLVWIIRVLIIGTLSVAGDRLSAASKASSSTAQQNKVGLTSTRVLGKRSTRQSTVKPTYRRKPSTPGKSKDRTIITPEPTYHPVSMKPKNSGNGGMRGKGHSGRESGGASRESRF